MISLEEAQARLLALRGPVEAAEVPLAEAIGHWAAADVIAKRTQPVADLSAMDGYAIRHADLPGPWTVIGESAAGQRFTGSIGPYQAARIFTGALIPDGADTVVVQEDVSADGGGITLSGEGPTSIGSHIRARGGDFGQGEVLITKGARLNPAHIGLAAMGGHANVPVHRKVRVALVSTGDELVPPGGETAIDQIPSSNAVMLATLLKSLPVEVLDWGIVPDRLDAVLECLGRANEADIVVTLGGASVGDHDLVRPALQQLGADVDFWKVAMRPGKPVMAGMLGDTVMLGLPGNPVSAYVTAILFLLPLIARLSGAHDPLPQRQALPLGEALPANGPRLDHVRARIDGGFVVPIGQNDSSMLQALASAHALIVRSPYAPAAEKADLAEILLLP